MRTNIDIQQDAIAEIAKIRKAKNHKKTIEEAILHYTRKLAQEKLLKLRGKVVWEGNLEEMRTSKYL